MNPKYQNYVIAFVVIALVLLCIFSVVQDPNIRKNAESISLSLLLEDVEGGKINQVKIFSDLIQAEYKDGSLAVVETYRRVDAGTLFINLLKNYPGIQVELIEPSTWESYQWYSIEFLRLVFTAFATYFILSFYFGPQYGNTPIIKIQVADAKLQNSYFDFASFSDIGGQIEAVNSLIEIVNFCRDPAQYIRLGAHIPKRILLYGPPGTGKTLLAHAFIKELRIHYIEVVLSEVNELYMGVGAARLRHWFKQAKSHSPCILLLDHIERLANTKLRSLESEKEATSKENEDLNTFIQLLNELDDLEENRSYLDIMVIMVTHRLDLLDLSLLRPGRVDRLIGLALPDGEERVEILKIHARGKPVPWDLNWSYLSSKLEGFSGADIESVLNESAILAAARNYSVIPSNVIEEVIDNIQTTNNRSFSQKTAYSGEY